MINLPLLSGEHSHNLTLWILKSKNPKAFKIQQAFELWNMSRFVSHPFFCLPFVSNTIRITIFESGTSLWSLVQKNHSLVDYDNPVFCYKSWVFQGEKITHLFLRYSGGRAVFCLAGRFGHFSSKSANETIKV